MTVTKARENLQLFENTDEGGGKETETRDVGQTKPHVLMVLMLPTTVVDAVETEIEEEDDEDTEEDDNDEKYVDEDEDEKHGNDKEEAEHADAVGVEQEEEADDAADTEAGVMLCSYCFCSTQYASSSRIGSGMLHVPTTLGLHRSSYARCNATGSAHLRCAYSFSSFEM
jgi:hypothetical protein